MDGEVYKTNPYHLVPPGAFSLVRMWAGCRNAAGGFGGLAMPEAGGYFDQCAWTMDAFRIIGEAYDDFSPKPNKR